ncbi:hypothetical protein T439DRAFT_325962 [Meredithblackwellia eburnea MCA 4105]
MPSFSFSSKSSKSTTTSVSGSHSNASSASLESVPSSSSGGGMSPSSSSPAAPTTTAIHARSTKVTDEDTAARATFVLHSGEESKPIGSTTADPDHPDILVDKSGAPVTTLPSTSSSALAVSAILSSGERGPGPQGRENIQAFQSPTKVIGGTEAVVGEAKGVAPEAVGSTTPDRRKDGPWFKRIVDKLNKGSDEDLSTSGGSSEEGGASVDKEEGGGEQPVAVEGLGALGKVVPAPGVDLSNIGLGEGGSVPEGAVVDKDGNPIPTKLRGGTVEMDRETTLSSIKDSVLAEHAADPSTSDEKFHSLFPQIPEDDELVEDYRCALQKEILVQGRTFVSERHLSFRANIFGWETSLMIPWSEVTTIEKRMTAMVIPNAIEVTTPHARHTFASFINRDAAFDLFVALWRHSHPEAASSNDLPVNGNSSSEEVKADSKSELSYTDDTGIKKKYRFKPKLPSALKSIISRDSNDDSDGEGGEGPTPAEKIKADALMNDGGDGHPPTEYDGPEFKNVAMDVVLPTSPELVYEMMFTDKEFLTKFLTENQGVKDLDLGDWSPEKERDITYIKPLNAPMGPKETQVNIHDKTEKDDPESFYNVVTETHTPDVPSGSQFYVMTRTVLTWSDGGGCHAKVTTEVTWTKVNRILKGIIERSCLDGQKTYHQDLEKAMREHMGANKSKFAVAGASEAEAKAKSTDEASASASVFGPLTSVVETVSSFLPSPVIVLSILVVVLLFTNFFTLLSLRQYARELHYARLGSPEEVASAVRRVLGGFSQQHEKLARRGGLDAAGEVGALIKLAQGIEGQMGSLKDRLEALKSL